MRRGGGDAAAVAELAHLGVSSSRQLALVLFRQYHVRVISATPRRVEKKSRSRRGVSINMREAA